MSDSMRTIYTHRNRDRRARGMAVACWAGSFVAGCRNRDYELSTMYSNLEGLRVESGHHPKLDQYGQHPDAIASAVAGIRDAIDSKSTKAGEWFRVQYWLLVIGALFYLAWHVITMATR